MPLQATSGAASYDAFGGGVAAVPTYIEDIFSTYLYTGNGSTQTITNGIDESGKGAMTWIKCRSDATSHALYDTERGAGRILTTNTTGAQTTSGSGRGLSSFNSTGFSLDDDSFSGRTNQSGSTYVSWTFRKQPKFFDVVTWSGNGTIGRTISHSLGSEPGCIIVKKTNSSASSDWVVYHRSLGATKAMILNLTDSVYTWNVWNDTAPTSTVFSLNDASEVNGVGNTYVAYLFAHNAGGFGLTGTDNVISCGSYTGNGSTSGPSITLGYEPQWILIKDATDAGPNWAMFDNMRGIATGGTEQRLYANTSGAEATTGGNDIDLTATGFDIKTDLGYLNTSGSNYIYIAIRRGPMKVPTSGTSVFTSIYQTPQSAGTLRTVGFPADLMIGTYTAAATPRYVNTRLTGLANNSGSAQTTPKLQTQSTAAESNAYPLFYDVWNTTARDGDYIFGSNGINWMFGRAPSFFDVVCYTGTGVANTAFTHNLTVTPELMIVKPRSAATAPNWRVWSPINSTDFNLLQLSTDGAASSSLYSSSNVFPAIPTATTFTVGGSGSIQLNESGQTFVAYLFATCAGVSKVTTFTGNGSSQTINCGFTGGARFVLIKRVDSTGNWVTFDTARGIVSGNDPALYLNSTAAEVTGVDAIDPDSTGFIVNQESTFNLNVSSATYLVLAIA